MKISSIYIILLTFIVLGTSCEEKKYNNADTLQGEIGDARHTLSDTIGNELKMVVIPDNYYQDTRDIPAIVFNPQKNNISYGRDWELERYENGVWYKAKLKKNVFRFDDEFLSITPPEYMTFSFPIHIY